MSRSSFDICETEQERDASQTRGGQHPSVLRGGREQTRWLDTTCKSNAFHKLVSRVRTSKHCLQDEDFNTIKAPLLVALIRKQPLLTQRLSHQLRGLEYTPLLCPIPNSVDTVDTAFGPMDAHLPYLSGRISY